jgi:ABC-type nitrate/sulfonate/bicarbonate transport system permease component
VITAASGQPLLRRASGSLPRARRAAAGVVLLAAVLAAWQALADAQLFGAGTFPGPWGIWTQLIADRELYGTNTWATLSEALPGLAYGAAGGIATGVVFAQWGWAEKLLSAAVIGLMCAPMIALAPVFYVVFSPYAEKVLIAAFSAFFPVLVATLAGLRQADPLMIDVVRSCGGGAAAVMVKVRLRAALPTIASGVQIAFPAAVLGAILGEFAGGTSGLGVFMMNSLAQFNPERTWGAGAVATVLGTAGYGAFGLARRALLSGQPLQLRSSSVSDDVAALSFRWPARIALSAGSLVIVIGGWWLALRVLSVSPYFGKTPADVWRFLFIDDGASGADRSDVLRALGATLPAALIGAALGLVVAYVVAVLFLWSRSLQSLLLTFAMVIQAVPLQAMTPLIIVVIGRGIAASVTVAVLVTLFPSVVLMAAGLRDVPRGAVDVFRYLSATEVTQVRKLRTPAALPAIFAAARLGLPGALMGVLVAEYLATGQGVGFILSNSAAMGRYTKLWTATVIITLVSVAMYAAVARAERWAARVYGGR